MIHEHKHYEKKTTVLYKYELIKDVYTWCSMGKYAFELDYMSLKRDGTLIIHKGYAWDGCSGPVIDTDKNLHGSLIHDALYQAMREGYIPSLYRLNADTLFYLQLRSDGVGRLFANVYYWAVRMFGKKHAAKRQVL